MIDPKIFRAYDIRGIVDTQLTEETLEEIGLALGSECIAQGCNKIVIAKDGRLSGPKLISALTRGLLQTGINIIDIGCVPSPLLYYATYYYQTGCGAVLTGSHNSAEYNGVKMMVNGKTISEHEIQNLYNRIQKKDYIYNTGTYQENFIIDYYIREVTGRVKLNSGNKKLKLVIDCGNGVTGVLAEQLYTALGCDVICLYTEVDGSFPNHHPDPSNLDNLKQLQQTVLDNNADLGFAFDGDGDRLGLVTNTGEVVLPDRQLMLFARSVLNKYKNKQSSKELTPTIVFDVKCSKLLSEFILYYNGIPCMHKTGHSHIKNKLKETKALLAGEMSGHIFFNENWYGFDDALYSGVRLLEILANDYPECNLQELCEALPNSINTPELNISISDEKKFEFIEQLAINNNFNNSANFATLITIDGLRVEYTDGWGLVRASNTTPNLVLRFEAQSQDSLERIMTTFRNNILAIDSNLKF